jgi:hypothetical protein
MSIEIGYRGATACSAAGISYRQLDYWARTGLVEPTIRSATGSGSQRLYGSAVTHLRDRGAEDLSKITLMSDGASIYECTSSEEIFDLLQGGQGVFGIAIGKVWNEVEGSLTHLQGEDSQGEIVADGANDELAQRRKLRGA